MNLTMASGTSETIRHMWDIDLMVKYYLDHPVSKRKDLITNLPYGRNTIYTHWNEIVKKAEETREVSRLREEEKQRVIYLTI